MLRGSDLPKALIRVHKNEINDGHFEHLICCKENLFVQFVMCSRLFLYFNHVKTGGLSHLKSHNFVTFQVN